MKAWWPERIPLRLRVFFRGAFLLLGLATVALAVSVLREEKQLAEGSDREVFRKNLDQIAARLQHPSGQLALLNPASGVPGAGTRQPLVLPFSAIDFDDRGKAQRAVEMAGCLVQYADQAELCTAIGNSALAGGVIYLVGSFASRGLVEHIPGDLALDHAHRVEIEITTPASVARWRAPLESATLGARGVQGRLAGFAVGADGRSARHPDREFRGWLWQDGRCLEAPRASPDAFDCVRRAFFAIRVPVGAWREILYREPAAPWPPSDLRAVRVHLAVRAPGDGPAVFDSDQDGASPPFALADLRALLLPGEVLQIGRYGTGELVSLAGPAVDTVPTSSWSTWLGRLIRHLPVQDTSAPLRARQTVRTALGDYDLELSSDRRELNRGLAAVSARLSWFVAAMLAAILFAWLAIEVRIIRRITALTVRAAAVHQSVQRSDGRIDLKLDGLGGSDELGLLTGVLAELMQRVNAHIEREQIRAAQEKDMWHAVGHEILSPLQSLTALHSHANDPSLRYIQRMQQAVKVLYGRASPSEAILSARVEIARLDVRAFLGQLRDNAADAGIADVRLEAPEHPVMVEADEYPLEDAVAHVLSNAQRYRTPGSPITIRLQTLAGYARIGIHNQGPAIAAELLERIFEYGVSDGALAAAGTPTDARADQAAPAMVRGGPGATEAAAAGSTKASGPAGARGQGLFVARTYMAKMGGTIEAHNQDGGVCFVLQLRLAPV